MGMENAKIMSFSDGEAGVTLGALYRYTHVMQDITIVAVDASPSVDDPDLTIDINDDGTAAVSAVACATKATPGTWKSTHIGGTNAPVKVAAGSVLSLDANSAAAGTRVLLKIWYESGSVGS
jgi:hypothetical protein